MGKGIRVHELAKEFRISTAALKKHLQDLGVTVKSHMSVVETDVANRIRDKFAQQKAAIKRNETAKKKFHRHSDVRQEEPTKSQTKITRPDKKDLPKMPKIDDSFEIDTDDLPKGYKRHKDDKPKNRNQNDKNVNKDLPTHLQHKARSSSYKRKPTNDDRNSSPQRSNDRNYTRDDRNENRNPSRTDSRNANSRNMSHRNTRNDGKSDNRTPNRNDRRYNNNRPDSRNNNQRNTQDRDNNKRYSSNSRYDKNKRPDSRNTDRRNPNDRPNKDRKFSSDNRKPGFNKKPSPNNVSSSKPNSPAVNATALANKLNEKTFRGKDKSKKTLEEKNKHLKAKIRVTRQRKQKYRPTEAEEADISKNIRATMAKPKKKSKKRYKLQKEERIQVKEEKRSTEAQKISISEFTSVSELAKLMSVTPADIISKFFAMGQMVTINQRLDKESLEMICDEFDFKVSFEEEYGAELIEESLTRHSENVEEVHRPPVVTIMGHVDHGKTSILDYIRNENIVAGESGGITQHIGAYQVTYNEKKITFLDTPGHEAFTAMRARGANVTDIAIIVVAANDGVMPQTIEAIDHAKAAGVNIIVAINKIDLPEANPNLAINGILSQNILLENWGGDIPYVECSAKTGEGIDELLDYILLTSEMHEYTAKADMPAKGVVIEAQMDQQKGTFATILIQEGTLKKGDNVVCGATYGRVRRLENERQQEIVKLLPSDVAVIYGLNEVPKAGDFINLVETDKIARSISSERKQIRLEREKYQVTANKNNIFDKIREHQMSELKIILKADTDGSVEALADSFQKLSNDEVSVNIIHKSVGGIIEADVTLAAASEAIIVGFHVRSNNQAKRSAEEQNVPVKSYQIIYDAIEDVKAALSGMLAPEMKEQFLGNVLVKQVFRIKKVGQIAGAVVEKGRIQREAKLRLYRNNIMVHEGNVGSLKHYAQDVNEVKAGTECGIGIENYNDIKEGDIIEAYKVVEVERSL